MSERLEEIKDDLPLTIREYPDVEKLIEYVEELEGQLKTKLSQWSRACQKKDEFELKSYRYKQALEFYANEDNYIHDEWKPLNPNAKSIKMSQVEFDDGEKAREALEGSK